MLMNVKELYGYTVRAMDGDIGKIHDFYFSDKWWTIQYLVVEIGNWFSRKRVLISPGDFSNQPESGNQIFSVRIAKDMVKNSPDIDTYKPVSRQKKLELLKCYKKWPVYWAYPYTTMPMPYIIPKESGAPSSEKEKSTPYLRSSKEVIGYHIQAEDGEIGHVEDFIIDDRTWTVPHIVVDVGNRLPGRKVLISQQSIKKVVWSESKVYVSLSKGGVKNTPEYDPSVQVN